MKAIKTPPEIRTSQLPFLRRPLDRASTYNVVNQTDGDTGRPDAGVNVTGLIDRLATRARHELAHVLELGAFRSVLEAHHLHRHLVPTRPPYAEPSRKVGKGWKEEKGDRWVSCLVYRARGLINGSRKFGEGTASRLWMLWPCCSSCLRAQAKAEQAQA